MTDGENGPAPTQVSKVGPWAAAWMYLFLVALGLSGPFLMVLGVFAGQGLVITGIVCTVVLVPLGFALGLTVAAERRYNRRLDAFGVPATAEITELTEWDTGDDGGAVVVLRVSGPDFRTFEATWKRSQHPALRVGLRIDAVVDPSGNLFRVVL
ncbi:hypothetical protein P1S61_12860 [Streptomyces sp. ME08-AFT2]|uniref:hypothetical protein n=1 Tax=Streptomyces sp. ME08-AFT2 TaxID=3028683 RepID=UPI0029B283EE|nr:hypothetical protein [Streptomyces sp. ME08-AFT2]MDX3309967.1 hypothetical protein [Streptomyces sp. ME08-AFT2]